jgi:hypothetical protein
VSPPHYRGHDSFAPPIAAHRDKRRDEVEQMPDPSWTGKLMERASRPALLRAAGGRRGGGGGEAAERRYKIAAGQLNSMYPRGNVFSASGAAGPR